MTAKAPAKKPAKAKPAKRTPKANAAAAKPADPNLQTQGTKPSESAGTQTAAGSPSEHDAGAQPAAEPNAKAPAKKPADGRREERLPIETTTARGDWVDPFSGLTVAVGNEVNPTNFARREGDEAVMWVTD